MLAKPIPTPEERLRALITYEKQFSPPIKRADIYAAAGVHKADFYAWLRCRRHVEAECAVNVRLMKVLKSNVRPDQLNARQAHATAGGQSSAL